MVTLSLAFYSSCKKILDHSLIRVSLCSYRHRSLNFYLRSSLGSKSVSQLLRHNIISINFNQSKSFSSSISPEAKASAKSILEKKIIDRHANWDPRKESPGIIYEGPLRAQIKSVKVFSLTTSVMGLGMQVAMLDKIGNSSLGGIVASYCMIGFFTYVTPILIHYMARRYVLDISYDPKTDVYTAATYSLFLKRNEVNFKVEDIVRPEVPGPFTTFLVKEKNGKNRPLFVADISFREPKHFGRFMGYDKPIDFKLSPEDVDLAMEQKSKK